MNATPAGPDPDGLEPTRSVVSAALAPLGLAWRETRPGVFTVSLPGTHKLVTECALQVGRYGVGVRAFVARQPDENHAGVYRWLLQRNLKLRTVCFSLDAVGDIYLTGTLAADAVSEDAVDRVLGELAETADAAFNVILELGFATSIRREWVWRRSRGESTANLAAFRHLDPDPGGIDGIGDTSGGHHRSGHEVMNQAFVVRVGLPADVDGLLDLWLVAAENAGRPADDPDVVLALLGRDPEALLLAEDEGQLIGSVIAGWDGWRAHLYRLAVRPDHRRRGVGRALLAAAEERLSSLGARRFDAMVLDDNELGSTMWQAAGYTRQPDWARWVKSPRPPSESSR